MTKDEWLASRCPSSPAAQDDPAKGLEIVDAAAKLREQAESIRAIHRRFYREPLSCDTINNALEYGRAQGLESAADTIKKPLTDHATAERQIAELRSRVAELEAEIARLTPKPSPYNALSSAAYREGPLTAALYDEAIADLENGKRALVEGDGSGCQVCGDSGHSANGGCHHNPLILARQWARASGLWQCWHCGYIATNEAEATEHFGIAGDEDELPQCLAAKDVTIKSLADNWADSEARALAAEAENKGLREAIDKALCHYEDQTVDVNDAFDEAAKVLRLAAKEAGE